MANQPTKYRKFVVGAASAALVASAVAPVASAATFSDVSEGNSHKASIDALVAKGVISGYPDGTFKPTQTLKRSDVVKMMGKWLKSEGYTVAADYKTNPRFADLTSSSNEELLEMAALVKDNGLFVGTPDGKLDPNGNITRENMAIVIVRAFDTVHNIDLATYVAGQEFKKDVVDLAKAKAEARPAIDVLDYFDITNPAAPSFNPKDTTNRAQFASFLNKAIETDYSEVATGVVGDATVKAINATTVEVTFKEDVKDVKTSDYTIEGLAISNAAVKQTDSKVVVLTTAVQTGDKEYTLKSGETTLGTFKGISAVIPTSVTVSEASVQGIVGKEVTLKADIGVKEAGVPVTFNVKADDKLNNDQVVEALTNAEGIATYSYTQYAAGNDEVAVYATGAPAKRDLAKVYWGVDSILTIATDDKKGNEISNGENKTYTVTYKDAKTGKVVPNQTLHVTFAENVDTTIDKVTRATVNGKEAYQLTNGKTEFVTVTTNSKGEATLTVSGMNTKATPVVFVDDSVNNRVSGNNRLEVTELQAKADQLVIGAVQSSYVIDVVRDGKEEAATGYDNGRKYKVTVKTKDGKVAANEWVNVAFNEDVDRNMNTITKAVFVKDKAPVSENNGKQISVKLNAKGEGSFTIATATGNEKDYATPVVWLDINSSNAKTGTLDEGEPSKVADITYFAKPTLTDGVLKAYDSATSTANEIEEDDKFAGNKTAYFKFTAANQSGNEMPLNSNEYDRIEASFTVFNTGSNDVTVFDSNGTKVDVVSPGRSLPVTVNVSGNRAPMISVDSDDKTTEVRVEARGTAIPVNNRNNNWNNNWNNAPTINLGGHTAKVSFVSTKDVGTLYTGLITSINTVDKKIQFDGKDAVSYKGATFKNYYGNNISQLEFETEIKDALAAGKTHRVTLSKDSDDKVTVSILTDAPTTAPQSVQDKKAVTDAIAAVNIPTTDVQQPGDTFAVPASIGGVDIAWESSSNLLSIANGTATVGAVTEDTTVTLTAVYTKGDAKETKKYAVKLSPVVVPDVTKGQLLGKVNDADVKVQSGNYTLVTTQALEAAILEAQAVLVGTPTQAELNKAAADLDVADNALKSAVTATASGLVITFAENVAGSDVIIDTISAADVTATIASDVDAEATASVTGKTLTITLDSAVVLANGDKVEVKVTVNGVSKTLELTYDGSDWALTGTPVSFK